MDDVDKFLDAWAVLSVKDKEFVAGGICEVLGRVTMTADDIVAALDQVERDGIQTGAAA